MDVEKDRVIEIDLDLTETTLSKNETTNTGKTFWTTDVDTSYLNFTSTYDIVGSTASLVLQNLTDGSDIQRTIEVGYNHFFYMLREDEIRRAGNWIGQIVIEKDGKALTSRSFKFTIKGALLDSSEPSLSSIDNYNKFYEQLAELETEMSEFLEESRTTFGTISANENERKTNELSRVAAETVREENYESKVTAAIVEADVVEKVDNKVAELTPTIQQVTAQLAQTIEDVNRATSELTVDSELILARNSTTKSKGFTTLDSRLEEIEADNKLKANKQQTDWITPTLLSGATVKEGSPVGYMKDEMGFVHFKGKIILPNYGTQIMALPIGYRPSSTINSLVYVSLNTFGNIIIQWTGGMFPAFPYNANAEYDLSNIKSYKAEK